MPRTLIFSQRNIYKKFHYRCYLAEFEDLICQMDNAELLAPQSKNYFRYGARIANRLASHYSIWVNPGIPKTKLKKDYDLFFAFCQFPRDLLHIETVEGWKDRCKTSICWLAEIWISELVQSRNYLKILSKFDHVILHWSQSVNPVNDVIGDKAFFSPLGIDAILFCPYPNPPQRSIDVYSIGRRSEKTHHALLKMAEGNKLFYLYDSFVGREVMNTNEHRTLFANLIKRSKYFIVNPGKIDSPEETRDQSEIGNRYFEGAAGGSIMIGEHPKTEEFKKIFYWEDAVIHLPYGSNKIQETISEFEERSRGQSEIRKRNVLESLMKHDWAYRWETMLKTAGLEPMPGLSERKNRLENLSKLVENEQDPL